MFRRYLSKKCIIFFSFTFLICYFLIVQYRISIRCAELRNGLIWHEELSILEREFCKPESLPEREILEEIRAKINIETSEYNWNLTGVEKPEDLVMKNGGKPHRTLIATGWRTDSSFLGDLFSCLPGSFYYHEPLRYLNTTQVRREPLSAQAVKILTSIFECKSYDVAFNFKREKELGYSRPFGRIMRRVWDYWGGDIDLILDPMFMEKVCRLFPFQSVMESGVRLDVLKELMTDELNLHMVVLVRDPRAMVQSRLQDFSCVKDPECIKAEYLCADMVSDFYAAEELLHRFPERIRIIRFEELALHPDKTVRDLLDFLRIDMTKPVEDFLLTNTKKTSSKRYTLRESNGTASKWRTLMDFKQIELIQIACRGAMELWGYLPAYNKTHLTSRSFNPLGDYSTRLRY